MHTNEDNTNPHAEQSESIMQVVLHEMFCNATVADYANGHPTIAAPPELEHLDWVATYADRGVRSGNQGIVIRFRDGGEYHIEVIQTR